jgi:rhodanese-related sulfurtransferase
MMQAIKNMLGMGAKTNYVELVKQGAVILDVRSRTEFSGGHIQNAINIPIDELNDNLSRLKDRNKCIICCCASGMRSGAAKRILESKGYTAVYNGGGWAGLQNRL